MRTGLVSVSFRALSAESIIEWSVRAGIEVIEWGGDVHCPHGNPALARALGRRTREAGLAVSAYGSYYRLGHETDPEVPAFQAVLESALALEASRIRVWAGRLAPAEADEAYRRRVVDDALRVAELAAEQGIEIVTEYHAKTLTETRESVRMFFEAADHPNLQTYWQPPRLDDPAYCLESLREVLPRVRGLHVFHWTQGPDGARERRPLAEGEQAWAPWLALARENEHDPDALIEFVRDDQPEQFLADAAVLKRWLAG